MATPAGPTTVVNAAPTTLVDGQHLSQAEFHALYEATSPEVRAELIDGVVSMPSPARLEHGDAQLAVLIWLDRSEAQGLRAGRRAGICGGRAIDPDEIFWFALEHGALVQQSVGVDGLYRSTVFSGLWLDPSGIAERQSAQAPLGRRPGLRHARTRGLCRAAGGSPQAIFGAAAGIRPRSMIGLWESPGPNPMTPRRNGSAGHRRLLTNLSVLPVALKHYSRVGFAALTRESMTEFNFCLLTVPKNLWRMMPRESRM